MIDADIDFCSQQIEAQREMNRVGQMIFKLQNKFGQEKRILKDMVEHRRELKELKKMLKNQHAMIN